MTIRQRVVRWTGWGGEGLEHLCVTEDESGIVAESVVDGRRDAADFRLTYRLHIDLRWRVREVGIRMADGAELQLVSDGLGHWSTSGGTAIPGLAGCIDVDIAATPFTNSLPIRRLAPGIGAAETIRVAYVSVPDLGVEAVPQRYTRLAERRFLYEGLSTSFSAEIDVDADGIVLDYPGLFRRAP